ncbi:MAG: hypothetical protein LRS48_03035 [Desulfurococcales archaeon]|nr:hypothetical protein [Desulfurococcales archaeon]
MSREENYSRIHVYLDPKDLRDAAGFIVGSLLISRNVRRDTVTIVALKHALVIVAGDSVRQLRPDEESSTGWIRAVLRGKHKGLGAQLAPRGELRAAIEGILGARIADAESVFIVVNRGVNTLCRIKPRPGKPYIAYYARNANHKPPERDVPVTVETWLPAGYAASTFNIMIDRAMAGLEPCPEIF